MYSYFYGKIVDINEEEAVIDVHDIGYSFRYIHEENFKIGTTLKVFLYHVVREDDEFLVGFVDKEEKKVFEQFISVKGIGPRTAISALKDTTTEAFLNAISSGDVKYLKKLNGIGPKAASQIILDLKGKLVSHETKPKWNKDQEETILALRSLGFKVKEIEDVLVKLPETLSMEELIRESLRRLRSK